MFYSIFLIPFSLWVTAIFQPSLMLNHRNLTLFWYLKHPKKTWVFYQHNVQFLWLNTLFNALYRIVVSTVCLHEARAYRVNSRKQMNIQWHSLYEKQRLAVNTKITIPTFPWDPQVAGSDQRKSPVADSGHWLNTCPKNNNDTSVVIIIFPSITKSLLFI